MESIKENIIKEAKRVEEDSMYSAKGHFVVANFWMKFHLWIGVPTAILAAIAGASALSQFDNHNIIAGILAIVVTALTAVTTF
ncbi:MAG: SLATT domain-containing protein, partial [Proteobacteria bacterium]|nr:SLATT domain-containing protein [Pseudomonadota bacterium]